MTAAFRSLGSLTVRPKLVQASFTWGFNPVLRLSRPSAPTPGPLPFQSYIPPARLFSGGIPLQHGGKAAENARRLLKKRLERLRSTSDPRRSKRAPSKEEGAAQEEHDEEPDEEAEEPPRRSSSGKAEKQSGPEKSKSRKDPPTPKILEFEINVTQVMWGLLLTLFLVSLLMSAESVPEITYQEFRVNYLDRGLVSRLQVVNDTFVRVFTRESDQCVAVFTVGSVDTLERHLKEAQESLGIKHEELIPVSYVEEGNLLASLSGLLPTLLFLGFLIWLARRTTQRAGGAAGGGPGGLFSVGKTKAYLYNPQTDVKVKFEDVAGMDEAKTEIMEFVKFLRDPKRYERLGAKIPRGAILSGAPGTGKTMLAKATAGEAEVPFFSVSGSEFVEMFSGVGASRVRDLFKKAKEKSPSIVWIDEIDAIGKARAGAGIRGGNDEREATLNQLLVEMDGFDSDDHIVVMAGTNRPDMLDRALLRPGRFDRHINIDLPTLEGRKDIYKVHLKKVKVDPTITELPGKLAAMTPGFTGADIANCCNEAALAAARSDSRMIEMRHFEQAVDRVIAGLERRSRVLPKDKRKIVAYHEAGHAVAGWFLKYADPLVKVTIVPHGAAALGYAQLLPGDQSIVTQNRMIDLITVALGGRCSEEIFFGTVTVGASDDFQRITGIARSMVCDYGFSSKLGTVHLTRQPGSVAKSYSDATDAVVDGEIKSIIDRCHDSCKTLLELHREQVEAVAEELLAKEMLTRSDLVRILGERPYRDNEHEAFRKYLDA